MTYPVGAQYFDVTGKGSLVGIADEILDIDKLNREKRESAERRNVIRATEMLKYKIERRIRPSKKMTEAMVDMVEYIKANPGTRRKELYDKMLGGRLISPSSIGSNLKLLLDRKIIRTNNAQTQNRKFFYIEAIK
jgi:hypothetical protein